MQDAAHSVEFFLLWKVRKGREKRPTEREKVKLEVRYGDGEK